jgi:hypothetical protein
LLGHKTQHLPSGALEYIGITFASRGQLFALRHDSRPLSVDKATFVSKTAAAGV